VMFPATKFPVIPTVSKNIVRMNDYC
jgi:hypothetical protein